MPALVYSTTTADARRGWDDFDRRVFYAVAGHKDSTLDELAGHLPAGIAFHLIRSALETLAAGRLVAVDTTGPEPRYALSIAGRARFITLTRHGQQTAA